MKTKLILAALSVLALLAATGVPLMADEPVQVSLMPSTEELTVGDPVQLTLEVTTPSGYQVIIPKLERVWGPFEVRDQSQTMTKFLDDGTETTRQTIEVTLYDLGPFETPALPLTIRDASGQISQNTTPVVALNVVPTLAEDDSELRDIKPQATMRVPSLWPWLAAGLLAAVILGLLGWWAYRRSQGKPFGFGRKLDNRPPWQVAYDELARIGGLGLIEQGHYKRYYTLVTDCLRTYLEAQFHLQVFDRTTYELKPLLKQSDLAPDHVREILNLLTESDLVKFAKLTPDRDAALQLIERAGMLVDATRPQPEPEQVRPDSEPPVAPTATSQLSYLSGQ